MAADIVIIAKEKSKTVNVIVRQEVSGEVRTVSDGTAKSQTHYQQADVQPIEIMQMYMTPEQFKGFLYGNVLKYSLRYQYKGQAKVDLEKAAQYLKWLQQVERGEKINPRE